MPELFRLCEDQKMCLNMLPTVDGGLELRNGNNLQLECLETPIDMLLDGACKEWRTCLDNQLGNVRIAIITILRAAGVSSGTSLLDTGYRVSDDGLDQCIYPP